MSLPVRRERELVVGFLHWRRVSHVGSNIILDRQIVITAFLKQPRCYVVGLALSESLFVIATGTVS